MLQAQEHYAEALTSFQEALAIAERLVDLDSSNAVWQRDLSVIVERVGTVLHAQGKLAEALASYRKSLSIRQALLQANPSNPARQRDLQIAAGNLDAVSYALILARDFAKAIEIADEAIALAPDKVWRYANRAHALMFLDRTAEARALYFRYRGTPDVLGGKSWEEAIVGDFAHLRESGLTHPLMDEIEKSFAQTSDNQTPVNTEAVQPVQVAQ